MDTTLDGCPSQPLLNWIQCLRSPASDCAFAIAIAHSRGLKWAGWILPWTDVTPNPYLGSVLTVNIAVLSLPLLYYMASGSHRTQNTTLVMAQCFPILVLYVMCSLWHARLLPDSVAWELCNDPESAIGVCLYFYRAARPNATHCTLMPAPATQYSRGAFAACPALVRHSSHKVTIDFLSCICSPSLHALCGGQCLLRLTMGLRHNGYRRTSPSRRSGSLVEISLDLQRSESSS